MCRGGRFLCSFSAGAEERPDVPEPIADSLTVTADGEWVVWAHKLARPDGDSFRPLTNGDSYPRDAVARCRRGGGHDAPDLACTCGFHALSADAKLGYFALGLLRLDVALSGRILAFEWPEGGGVLFRAERQTVVHAAAQTGLVERFLPGRMREAGLTGLPPDDAGQLARRPHADPQGSGPVRLRLPARATAPVIAVADDIGLCVPEWDLCTTDQERPVRPGAVLAGVR